MRAVRLLSRFRDDEALIPWLRGVAVNVAREWFRRRRREMQRDSNVDPDTQRVETVNWGGRIDLDNATVRAAAVRSAARTTEAPRTVSAAQPRSAAGPDQQLRFSGPFGGADVTVRGPATTTVTIAERECWMEIRAGEAVVRLALREGCRKAAP